ncbi:MAG: hypothetical protein AB7N71_04790 [Phycisphaerae bacterium]
MGEFENVPPPPPPLERNAAGSSRAVPTQLPPHRQGDPLTRRCLMCGYSLAGAPERGVCPECGGAHGPTTDYWLQPWPSRLEIATRIAWPLLFLVLAIMMYLTSAPFAHVGYGFMTAGLVWLFALIAPLNGYLYVRRLLKKHLPENMRTRGTVAWLRGFGTVACALVFAGAVFVFLAPLLLLGACLIFGPPSFH